MISYKAKINSHNIDEYTTKELISVKEVVRELLENNSTCRNSDKWLTIKVMKYFAPSFKIAVKDIEKIPSFETIRRLRAHIQNKECLFLPDKEISEKRSNREKSFREFFGGENLK